MLGIDTLVISQSFPAGDYTPLLNEKWHLAKRRPRKLCVYRFETPKDSHLPRLTLSQTPDALWHLTVVVSFPAWERGFNFPLYSVEKIPYGSAVLTDYVNKIIPIGFNASRARVRRVDFAQDFITTLAEIARIIQRLGRIRLNRFETCRIKDETVYLNRLNQERNFVLCIYNKTAQSITSGHSPAEVNGGAILRLEARIRGDKIDSIQRKLQLPDISADTFLCQKVADYVLGEAKGLTNFDFIFANDSSISNHFLSKMKPQHVLHSIGLMVMLADYGNESTVRDLLGVDKRTFDRWKKLITNAGISLTGYDFDRYESLLEKINS